MKWLRILPLPFVLALAPVTGKADPAFDFHSGPCSFSSPSSGGLGPVVCRALVSADLPQSPVYSGPVTFADGTVISASGIIAGNAVTLSPVNSNIVLSPTGTGLVTINPATAGTISNMAGSFTTLSASSTVSGTGFLTYLASPPAIGGAVAAAGTFTTLVVSGIGYFRNNLNGGYPTINSGLALGENFSSAAQEQDFFNTQTSATDSFRWYQQTGASAATLLMDLKTSGLFVSSGLANSVTLAGSATNPAVNTSASDLLVGSTGGNIWLGGTTSTNASLKVGTVASAVNFVQAIGAITGQQPQLLFTGTDANVIANLSTKGTGQFFFQTGSGARTQFAILDNASGADYWQITSGASGASMTTNAGNGTIGTTGGTTNLTDATINLANIASSATALDAVCWNASGGVLTHNASGALCSASLEELKDNLGDIASVDANTELMALHPFWGKFKDSVTSISDHREQPFFGAHQVESVDPRLVEYDDDGTLRSVRYANITALLTAGYQHHGQQISDLLSRIVALEAREAHLPN